MRLSSPIPDGERAPSGRAPAAKGDLSPEGEARATDHDRRVFAVVVRRAAVVLAVGVSFMAWGMWNWEGVCPPPSDPTGCYMTPPGGTVEHVLVALGAAALMLSTLGAFMLVDRLRGRRFGVSVATVGEAT